MGDEVVVEQRRARLKAAPVLLRGGFRLFFIGGAAWSVIALFLWILVFAGVADLPTAFDPLSWHRHEMLFGFVGAIIVGFLMAAIPNWTSRPPIEIGRASCRGRGVQYVEISVVARSVKKTTHTRIR